MSKKRNQKIIALALVLNIVAQSSPILDYSNLLGRTDIFSEQNEGENLVLVLAEEELMQDNTAYQGLRQDYDGLQTASLEGRVERYATDIQSKLDDTKVEIVTVAKDESPVKIAALLKQAYFQNFETFNNRKLIGTVIIGEVPLPVVEKNEQRFVSLYPYTDFENPAYVYSPESESFEFDNTNLNFEPEIWHGVIDFSFEPDNEAKASLAQFLDKNHLYHRGETDFAEFDKKIFYSEPVHEKKSLDQFALDNYSKYQSYFEELVYNRASAKLLSSITGVESPEFEADLSMYQPVQSNLKTALDVYESSLSKQIEALNGTGRYDTKSIFTPVTAIAQKDDYINDYLKLVNQLLESKIDEAVASLEQDLIIPNGAYLTGTVTYSNQEQATITPQYFVNNAPTSTWITQALNSFNGLDLNRRVEIMSGQAAFSSALLGRNANAGNPVASYIRGFQMWVYGTPVSSITSADQCRIYRGGGTENPLDKTVKTVRGNADVCYTSDGLNVVDPARVTDSNYCSEFFGASLKQSNRTSAVSEVSKGSLTHESCFNMRPLDNFNQVLNSKYQGENLEQIFNLSNQAPSQVVLNVENRASINLEQILVNLPGYNREASDWNAWSYYLLGNPKKDQFVIQNPSNLNGVSKIELNVEKINSANPVSLSSVVKHQDPTPELRQALFDSGVSQDLPINATRYVSFVDKNGNNQELVYPNAFKSTSLADFGSKIRRIEQVLSELSGTNFENRILSVISNQAEQFNEEYTQLNRINATNLRALLAFNKSNLGQKYSSIYKNFLNKSDQDLLGFPKSFEMAIITAVADETDLDVSVLPEDFEEVSLAQIFDTNQEVDSSLEDLKEQFNQEESDRSISTQLVQTSVSSEQNSCANSAQGIPVTTWFTDYIPCWLNSVRQITSTTFSPLKEILPSYSQKMSNAETEVASIKIDLEYPNYSFDQFSEVKATISLLDANQNIIVGKPEFVTLKSFAGLEVDALLDRDPVANGVQLFMASGQIPVTFKITQAGATRIQASFGNIVADKNFRIYDSLNLVASLTRPQVAVNSNTGTTLKVSLRNSAGDNLPFKAPLVSLKNPELGRLQVIANSSDELNQEFSFQFNANSISAEAILQVSYPNLETIDVPVAIVPAAATKLYFRQLSSNFVEGDESVITLEVVDEFNNRVSANISGINLVSSDLEVLEVLTPSVNLVSGKTDLRVRIKKNGTAYLLAEKDGLESGIHKVIGSSKIALSEFNLFESPALYYELKLNKSGLKQAANIIKNGKAQSVSTLTADLNNYKPSFYVHPRGAYENASQPLVTTLTYTDKYRYAIFDNRNQEIAWVQVDSSTLDNKGFLTTPITEAGIYLTPNSNLLISPDNPNLYLLNQEPVFEIKNGLVLPLQPNITFEIEQDKNWFTFNVLQDSVPFTQVFVAAPSSAVIVQNNTANLNYNFKLDYTSNSTSRSKGAVFYDINNKSTLNSSQNRADSAHQNANQGLGAGAKSILLFASGMSAGEANRSYLAESGIVIGDPVISLTPSAPSPSGFNSEIGELIGKADSTINHILKLEDQILFADQNGQLSKFDVTNNRFYKNILKVENGIKEIIALDEEGKNLIVLTETACLNEDSCLYQIKFENDKVQTIPLNLNLNQKANKILAIDYDLDQDKDLLILADNNLLYLAKNTNQNFNTQLATIGNIFNQLNSGQSLLDSIFISGASGVGDLNPVVGDFYQLSSIPALSNTTLNLQDLNQGLLRSQDRIRYTLNLQSTTPISNGKLSLPIDSNQQLVANSLTPQNLTIENTTSSDRPFLISNINLSAGETLSISFETVYTADSETETPLMTVVTDEGDNNPDGYPDIKIVLTGANKIIYYNSDLNTENRTFAYERAEKSLTPKQVDLTSLLPVPTQTPSTPEAQLALVEQLRSQNTVSSSQSRPETSFNQKADKFADSLNKLRCSGAGCLAVPVNRAFLVPSPSIAALPVFGWGCPGIPPTWPPYAFQTCAGGRQYLSPTLTGELVSATCLGPFMAGSCWTFRVTDLGAACDAINATVEDFINNATELVTDGTAAATGGVLVVSPSRGKKQNVTVPGFPAIFTDWFSNQVDEFGKILDLPDLTLIYPSTDSLIGYFQPVEVPENIGYLAMEDILNELSTLPLFDITIEKQTVKYPWIPNGTDLDRYVAQYTEIIDRNLTEVYNTFQQWECFGTDISSYANFKGDLTDGKLKVAITNAVVNNPNIDPYKRESCIRLVTTFEGFHFGLIANLEELKKYRDLPKNIFAIENFVADYATQALGYAEVILDRTSGFLVDNTQALKEWQNFFVKIQNLIGTFKATIDFVVNFMSSCDDCRTDRTNLDLQLLFNILFQFPSELPVLTLPKLPDITLDVSKIELGVDIVLPDFQFVPERVNLPSVNSFVIDLPDAPPIGLDFNFGQFGLNPIIALPPAPDLEKYILDFPPLPALEVPNFPVIPRPPDVGLVLDDYLATIEPPLRLLSNLLRIVCIVTKGIVPVPEAFLRTKIESMTNRPLTPVLPIDLNLSFQFPKFEYEYVSEYKLIFETYFNLEFDALSTLSKGLVSELNQLTSDAVFGIEEALQNTQNSILPPVELDLNPTQDIDLDFEADFQPQEAFDNLTSSLNKLNSLNQTIPENLTVTATTETLTPEEVASYDFKYKNKVPSQLKENHNKLIAFKQSINSKSSRNLASLNSDIPATEQTILNQVTIAQAAPNLNANQNNNAATFNPENGIYFIDPLSQRVERLVNYTAEQSKTVKTTILDQNIFYTIGNEIYFKHNFKNPISKTPLRGAVRTYQFDQLEPLSSSSLENSSVTVNSDNRSATFTLSNSLSNQTSVLDIYTAGLTQSEKVARYVMNSKDTEVPKDGFNIFETQDSFTQNFTVPLQNQNYRATLSVFNEETSKFEVVSNGIPFTPNICQDNAPPVFSPSLPSQITTSLYQPVIIDLSKTTDLGSAVTSIWLDSNLSLDLDADEDPTNDKNLVSSNLNTKFRLNGFSQVGTYRIKVWAKDEANNLASKEISIKVNAPSINFNLSTNSITGTVSPQLSQIPISIIRERDGVSQEIATVRTNGQGQFNYNNLSNSDSLQIKNVQNQAVFELNTLTGSIKPLLATASIGIRYPSTPGDPTVLLLRNENQLITTFTKLSDLNQDAEIVDSKPSRAILSNSSNLYALDENPSDSFVLSQIAGSDPEYAGSISLNLQGNQIAIFDTNGGIKFLNQNLQLRLQPLSDLTQYQWFEVLYQGEHIASILPTFAQQELKFSKPEVVARVARPPLKSEVIRFEDVNPSNPNAEIIEYLKNNGVIEGVEVNGQRFFQPTRQITRAEYAKIILKILCINPRPESYLRPSVFSDIPFGSSLPWYYADTKETQLQKIFTGYLGEIEPTTRLAPFKPNNSISMAEATKVVLEALVNTEVINLENLEVSSPWYLSYLEVAQNITPYLTATGQTPQNFILTPSEASQPNKLISREEFAVIAFRVLQLRNCIELNRANNTGSQNQDTSTESTPESSAPTNTGSISESASQSSIPTSAGLYLDQLTCVTCPCQYRYEYLATFRKNDKIYMLIKDPETGKILQKSSELIIN